MEYLVFRLYGPMASWGEIAVGESRHSAAYPSKSAICGLLAAGLGIDRTQEAELLMLSESYAQAVKVLSDGLVLKDYHTAQAPDSAGKYRYRTRRDELVYGKERLGTVLSSREYRTDSQALVAIRRKEGGLYSLNDLQQALLTPVFHLYLGRKSCPLAAPLDPQVVVAENFKEALDAYVLKPLLHGCHSWEQDGRWLKPDQLIRYMWEGDPSDFFAPDTDLSHVQLQERVRHDLPISRTRWQFQPRKEYLWSDLGQGEQ